MTPPGNRVHAVCHPDFLRLEQELCLRLEALRPKGSIPRILIFATTLRQQRRLQHVLARHFRGLLGVDVLTHYTYARRLTEGLGLRDVTPMLQETVLRYLVNEGDTDGLTTYLREFPSALSRLGGVMTELREAGISAEDLEQTAERDQERDLARLFSRYERALADLARLESPTVDRAGRTRAAVERAGHEPPATAVFQYGAHELVGMNLDLIRAIPCEQPVVWLAPVDAQAKAWEYARRDLAAIAAQVDHLTEADPRPFVSAARCFCDWDAPAEPLPEGALELWDAQGPESETETVARRLMADIFDGGYDPADLAVVVRNLEPYAPSLEAVFKRHHLPVDSSLQTPLSREPGAHTFVLLLQALQSNLERQAVMDLARAPALRRPGADEEAWTPDWWESWSRGRRLVRGAAAWTELAQNLEAGAQKESMVRASARTLGQFIDALETARAAWERTRTSSDHVALLETWAEQWIHGDAGALKEELNQLRDLDGVIRALWSKSHVLSTGEVLQSVRRLLGDAQIPWAQSGGIAVLDVLQARGLTFDRVYWMGFNADWLPKRASEDPFLIDAVRTRLRNRTGRPLSLRRDGDLEEQLLFAQTALCPREHLEISRQRADAEGRSMAPSLYLDQIMRIAPNQEPARVPAHPKALAEWQLEHTKLLSPEEGALLSTWNSGASRPRAVLAFLRALECEHLIPQAEFAAVVDRAGGDDLRFDSVIEQSGSWTDMFSPSSLETLGRCPHQYFYSRVLGIKALREQAQESGLDPLEVGNLIHKVLELTFADLRGAQEVRPVVEGHFQAVFQPVQARLTSRYPLSWEAFRAMWLDELVRFVEKDLRRFRDEGWRFVQGEQDLQAEIEFTGLDPDFLPERMVFQLEGRVDRRAESAEGHVLISDYKTGGKLEDWIEANRYLRGHKLQLSLYGLLVGPGRDNVKVELLGLGPRFQPDRGFVNDGPVTLDSKYKEEGLKESVALLVDYARRGLFPLNEDRHCSYCDFAASCRKSHVPTKNRVEEATAFHAYRLLQQKTAGKPLLADLKGKSES